MAISYVPTSPSTAPHTVGIPSPGDSPESVYQATLAIKQNIEIAHGFQEVMNRSKPHAHTTGIGLSAVNPSKARSNPSYGGALGAAISLVKATLP